jgi:lipopolysaccharide export system protein LptA
MSRNATRLGACLLVALAAYPAAAQEARSGQCLFTFRSRNPGGSPLNMIRQPSGQFNWWLGQRARGECTAQQITVEADSVEFYGDARLLYLIGNVDYREPRLTLKSQRLTYWLNDEHLRAEGNVDATLSSGTRLTGPEADYYRPAPGIRTASRMVAPRRPTILLVETDSAGRRSEPTTLVANTVVMNNDSLVYAGGRVVITRTDVIAHADSAFMDAGREYARLMRSPRIEGRGDDPFTLTGNLIELHGSQRALSRVLSSGKARAVSEDVTLTSDTLDMRLTDSEIQRVFAWGQSRARAVSPEYDIVADSLDVQMPGQRVREVYAVRNAFAQSSPDSTRLRSAEKDWLRGDTIVARFDTLAAPRDTSSRPRIRDLIARGHASSFYQVATSAGRAGRPGVNYVRGRVITVTFEDQAVETVRITEQAAGVYLEPPATVPGDTTNTAAPVDSVRAARRPPTSTRRAP